MLFLGRDPHELWLVFIKPIPMLRDIFCSNSTKMYWIPCDHTETEEGGFSSLKGLRVSGLVVNGILALSSDFEAARTILC
jgi:hypothetical protein